MRMQTVLNQGSDIQDPDVVSQELPLKLENVSTAVASFKPLLQHFSGDDIDCICMH